MQITIQKGPDMVSVKTCHLMNPPEIRFDPNLSGWAVLP